MTARVLFLDLDGVCNDRAFVRAALAGSTITRWSSDLARKTLDPVRVARVDRVCSETGARIVLVSGWRRWAPVEEITACLRSAGLRAEVLGAVGGVGMYDDMRCTATLEWLAAHPEVTGWCVVDDDATAWQRYTSHDGRDLRAWLDGREVRPVDGITDEDASACVAALLRDVTTDYSAMLDGDDE